MRDLIYTVGALIAKLRAGRSGAGNLIHPTVEYKKPGKLFLGDKIEVRRGTELDSRSKSDVGIEIGNNCRIKEYCTFAAYGGSIVIGRNVLVGRNCAIFGHGGVIIGDFSMLGPNVCIFSSEHICTDSVVPFQRQGFTRERTEVGANVWIGAGAMVLAGVRVVDDVVIGAGSLVVKDILESGVYGGTPAVRIRGIMGAEEQHLPVHYVDWALNG